MLQALILLISVALHWTLSSELDSLHVSLVVGSLEPDPAVQMCLTSSEQRVKIISLDLLAMVFLFQLRRLLAFIAMKVHCWLVVSLLSTSTLWSVSAKVFAYKITLILT